MNGSVYAGAGPAQELMDTDTSVRDLPLLRQRLEVYSSAAKSANSQPLVQILVEGEAQQQRVVDVLNALAGAQINQVTFTDLIDPP
jgi:biopolymer transport protein ExbD